MYDPQLGRFHAIDPLADEVPGISPYQFGFNNPIAFQDPSGLFGEGIIVPLAEVVFEVTRSVAPNILETVGIQTMQALGVGMAFELGGQMLGGPTSESAASTASEEESSYSNGFIDGLKVGAQGTIEGIKEQFTVKGLMKSVGNNATLGLWSLWDLTGAAVNTAQQMPNYNKNDWGRFSGVVTEKALEYLIMRKAPSILIPKVPLKVPSKPLNITKSNPTNLAGANGGGKGKYNGNFEKMGKQKGSAAERMPRDVANKLGIDYHKMKEAVHKYKQKNNLGGADNLSWNELLEIGKQIKK